LIEISLIDDTVNRGTTVLLFFIIINIDAIALISVIVNAVDIQILCLFNDVSGTA
jgi:hypothetical protein